MVQVTTLNQTKGGKRLYNSFYIIHSGLCKTQYSPVHGTGLQGTGAADSGVSAKGWLIAFEKLKQQMLERFAKPSSIEFYILLIFKTQ